jgi:cytochrome c oxidase subunit 3
MSVADESAEDHGEHHLPAVDDWPRGFGEASWWPFIAAIGAAGIYVGIALFFLGHGEEPMITPLAGPAAIIGSAGLFLFGLYGWTYHAFIVNFWEHTGEAAPKLKFSMLLFLGTEVATFGAGFVYYFFLRGSQVWSPELLPEGGVLGLLVFLNTAILILSSITLHFAHVSLRKNQHARFRQLLGMTLVLGIVFLAGQVLEYYEFIIAESFTITEGAYASAFYGLTGLHGLHVSLGVALLGIVYARGLMGQYDAEHHTSVSTVSMYWHFVDVVWVFLVVVLYVAAAPL